MCLGPLCKSGAKGGGGIPFHEHHGYDCSRKIKKVTNIAMSADLLQARFRKVHIKVGEVDLGLSSQVVEVGGQCHRGDGCVIHWGKAVSGCISCRWSPSGARGEGSKGSF